MLGNLTDLEEIEIHSGAVRGTLPETISSLRNLEILKIIETEIEGRLTTNLPPTLTYLALFKNRLRVYANSIYSKCPKLAYLNIHEDGLTGNLLSIEQLANLKTLLLASGSFNGSIPVSITRLTNLQLLGMYETKVSGTLPNLRGMLNLTDLTLSNLPRMHGSLLGKLPSSITRFKSLFTPFRGNFSFLANLPLITSMEVEGCCPTSCSLANGNVCTLGECAPEGSVSNCKPETPVKCKSSNLEDCSCC